MCRACVWPCIFMGRAPASLHLFWEDFSKQGAGQDDCKAPREGAPLCSPTAPLPLPSQRGGTPAPCPGRAAPEVTFVGRLSPGACHHGSKGRLMGGFYYSHFCRGILPLFIMAFPPVTGGGTQGKAGAGSVCSNVSRCVFRAMVFGAKPLSALPVCWILHPFGGGRQSPSLGGVSATQGCFELHGTDPRAGNSERGAQRSSLCAWSKSSAF